MQFKQFLLSENRAFFSNRVGDILNALQDLSDNADSMGTRELVRNSEGIANQIRGILHTHWPQREETNLRVLQKCGVALMKAIEEKDQLKDVIDSCVSEIEEMMGDLGAPINKLASPPGEEYPKEKPKKDTGTGESQGPEQQDQTQQQMPQAMSPQQQMPQQAQMPQQMPQTPPGQ